MKSDRNYYSSTKKKRWIRTEFTLLKRKKYMKKYTEFSCKTGKRDGFEENLL